MENANVTLLPLTDADREQFILENQRAFKYGAVEEFGMRDDHFEEDGEIISRKTIERCLDAPDSEAYRIILDGEAVGGVVLKINGETRRNELELLFVIPEAHSRGVGYGAWLAVEDLHPETEVWETCTPYFEKRNIHFYINKCGFSAVEFICENHAGTSDKTADGKGPDEGPDEMFRFEKVMR